MMAIGKVVRNNNNNNEKKKTVLFVSIVYLLSFHYSSYSHYLFFKRPNKGYECQRIMSKVADE